MTRVLLVEDDKNLSFILKSSLEQMIGGYEVISVANGKNGLDMLTKAIVSYKIIICKYFYAAL